MKKGDELCWKLLTEGPFGLKLKLIKPAKATRSRVSSNRRVSFFEEADQCL
jgi:hypothetical protein